MGQNYRMHELKTPLAFAPQHEQQRCSARGQPEKEPGCENS